MGIINVKVLNTQNNTFIFENSCSKMLKVLIKQLEEAIDSAVSCSHQGQFFKKKKFRYAHGECLYRIAGPYHFFIWSESETQSD